MEKNCSYCANSCVSCSDFEVIIDNLTDVTILNKIKKDLLLARFKSDDNKWGQMADWIVERVGTMNFFFICVILLILPKFFKPTEESVIMFSNFMQVAAPSLIMVAGNRMEKKRQFKNDREYRILLATDRIDEIKNKEN